MRFLRLWPFESIIIKSHSALFKNFEKAKSYKMLLPPYMQNLRLPYQNLTSIVSLTLPPAKALRHYFESVCSVRAFASQERCWPETFNLKASFRIHKAANFSFVRFQYTLSFAFECYLKTKYRRAIKPSSCWRPYK